LDGSKWLAALGFSKNKKIILFNTMSFEMGRSDGETQKYYIINVKITED